MDISIEGETKARRVEEGTDAAGSIRKGSWLYGRGETVIIAIIIYLCSPDIDIPPPTPHFHLLFYAHGEMRSERAQELSSFQIK